MPKKTSDHLFEMRRVLAETCKEGVTLHAEEVQLIGQMLSDIAMSVRRLERDLEKYRWREGLRYVRADEDHVLREVYRPGSNIFAHPRLLQH